MSADQLTGLFLCEGTSDLPLARLVETLFLQRRVDVRLSQPDFSLLPRVAKNIEARVRVGLRLIDMPIDLIVVHRDSDSEEPERRYAEILDAVTAVAESAHPLPVVPVRMTEAWLLLDEAAIRQVAGNPRGRMNLELPRPRHVESVADPKRLLQQCLVTAADCTGRRRDQMSKRFNEHRRQLLQRIEFGGPIGQLTSWQRLVSDIEALVEQLPRCPATHAEPA